MTDTVISEAAENSASGISKTVNTGLARRLRRERRFQLYGKCAIFSAIAFLLFMFYTIFSNALPAFQQTVVRVNVTLPQQDIDPDNTGNSKVIWGASYSGILKQALRDTFPDASSRAQKKQLYQLTSSGAIYDIRDAVVAQPSLIGTTHGFWVPAGSDVDSYMKNHQRENYSSRLGEEQQRWVEALVAKGDIKKVFNTTFFTSGDSREPELAGVHGALLGSLYTLLVTFLLSFPIGVATACYLEEFAPQNKWTDIIEVNINNLAAVPSIVFGLLGLAVFINFFGLPRSIPLVGGMVLSLMTLPTIIIAGRAALKSVPPSIREAALGMGASKLQTLFHHTLPLAMPGMLTGAIIGMAQALGESAPLLMIGMVAFIVDIPGGPLDPATVMPVQIFLWADSPERGFVEKTSAAIIVLLAFLILMNTLAVILRKRFERRW